MWLYRPITLDCAHLLLLVTVSIPSVSKTMLRQVLFVVKVPGFVSKVSGFETALFRADILINSFCVSDMLYTSVYLDLIILSATFFQPAAGCTLTAHSGTMASLWPARTNLSQRPVYQKIHRRWGLEFHCHLVSSVTVNISCRKRPLLGECLPARWSVREVCNESCKENFLGKATLWSAAHNVSFPVMFRFKE
jgi:hypothetical protein